jgi:hypothetical protein
MNVLGAPRFNLHNSVSLPGVNHTNGSPGGPVPLQRGIPGIQSSNIPLPTLDSHERENDYSITSTIPTVRHSDDEVQNANDTGPHQLLLSCTLSQGVSERLRIPFEKCRGQPMVVVKSISRLNLWLRTEEGKRAYRSADAAQVYADWKILGTQVDEVKTGETWRAFRVGQRTSIFHYWGINGRQPRDRQRLWLLLVLMTEPTKPKEFDPKDYLLDFKSTPKPAPKVYLSPPMTENELKSRHATNVKDLLGLLKRFVLRFLVSNGVTDMLYTQVTTMPDYGDIKNIAKENYEAAWYTAVYTRAVMEVLIENLKIEVVDTYTSDQAVVKRFVDNLTDEQFNVAQNMSVLINALSAGAKKSISDARLVGCTASVRMRAVATTNKSSGNGNESKLTTLQTPLASNQYWQLVPYTTDDSTPPPTHVYMNDNWIGRYYYVGVRSSVLSGDARAKNQNQKNAMLGTFPDNNTMDWFHALKETPRTEVMLGFN